MEINIYWKDLSFEGQQSLLDSGFTPTEAQENEDEPIGTLNTEENE
jgi:hypothetical protein